MLLVVGELDVTAPVGLLQRHAHRLGLLVRIHDHA